jgi:predicted amidohydrolase YtcJ
VNADLIFINGQVLTVNAADEVVQAVAIKGDRIAQAGSNATVLAERGPKTTVVDLQGRALLPGLIDAHCHIPHAGMGANGIDCKSVRSIAEIQDRLAGVAAQTPAGEWIRGRGWNQNKLAEGRLPTRYDLDKVAPDHPVILVRTCGHIAVTNSRGLALAGITPETSDPPGGQIDRDQRGVPTGVLRESAYMNMLKAAAYTPEEVVEGYRRGARELIRLGITTAHDAGGNGGPALNAMIRAAVDGSVPLRVYSMLFSLGETESLHQAALNLGLSTGLGNDRFRIGPFKLMVDGSSSGPTCATRRPYSHDPGNSGILYYTQEEIDQRYIAANRLGFQLTAHAVGDLGIAMVLNGIERAMADAPRPDPRHRVEHCAMCLPDLVDRVQQFGVVPVAQPVFFWEFGDGYVQNYGPERAAQMFPVKTFLKRGIPVAGSSDHPVTDASPLLGISVAMTRTTQSGQVVGPEERLSLLEAVRIYTMGGAYAAREEHLKGSIAVGKLADLTVLDSPILDVPAADIRDIPISMTVIGGQVVYSAR